MPRPARIDRGTVLDATLALADEEGLAAVSMRAVAARLGVTPMALYRHVGDKSQLLDGLVEQLLLELPLPDSTLPWHERLDALAAAMRATARKHPRVFPLLLQRPATTPGAVRARDAVYGALRDAGIDESAIPRVERLISTFVLGFAASEAAGRFTATPQQLDEDFRWAGNHIRQILTRDHAADGRTGVRSDPGPP
jgi:AcrR family transcriptional regulator